LNVPKKKSLVQPMQQRSIWHLKILKKKVFIIGEKSIGDELDEVGIKYRGIETMFGLKNIDEVAEQTEVDPEVGAVVIGLDPYVTYSKLAFAHNQLMKDKSCLFLATNTDSVLPVPGKTLPGSGSLVSSLMKSTGKEPIVLGKPPQNLMKLIIQSCKIDPKRTCMVGDRLDTDISFGIDGNLGATLLVLTGVVGPEWMEKDLGKKSTEKPEISEPEIFPSHVIPSLGDLHVLCGQKSKL